MPLDTAGFTTHPVVARWWSRWETPTRRLYRKRREAAAAMLRQVPPERLNMLVFDRLNDGLFVGCLLGWMAESGTDGWHWHAPRQPISSLPLSTPDAFVHAHAYFGLPPDAVGLFIENPGPNGVADRLLALPYTRRPADHWG